MRRLLALLAALALISPARADGPVFFGGTSLTGPIISGLTSVTVAPSGTVPASPLGYTPLGLLVRSSSDNAAESGFSAGQQLPSLRYLEQNFGGTNINNGRNALSVLLNMTAASNAANAYKFYVGSVFQSQTSVNDGGTGGSPIGVIEGSTGVGILKNGATNWLANFGAEFAISNNTGSSSSQKAALRLTEWPSDAVAGSSVDAFLAMSSDTGAPGLTQAINIDNSSGATPLNTSATVLKIGSAMSITTGLDFNNATISGNALQWKNGGSSFFLSGAGNASLGSIQTGNINFFSGNVSVGTCTGLGASGTCALATGSSPDVGKIVLTVAGAAPGSAGAFTLTFGSALGADDTSCTFTPQNGTGAWLSNATMTAQISNTTSATAVWANAGSALTAGSTWKIEYHCFGM